MITITSLRLISIILCLSSTFIVGLSPGIKADEFTFENTATASLQPSEIFADPVWPGDFNGNGIVEHSDLLIWGISYDDEIGPTRPNASTKWVEQAGPNWRTSINGINKKHQDANGDGVVDISDIEALKINYGNKHDTSTLGPKNNNVVFELESVEGNPKNKHVYDLSIESNGVPVSLHGFSCTFDFGYLPIISVYFDITNSSLKPSQFLQVWNPTSKTLDIALTRTDKVNQLCEGPVGTLIIIVDDISVFNTNRRMTVHIKNGGQMKASGQFKSIASPTIYEIFPDSNLSSKDLIADTKVSMDNLVNIENHNEYESLDIAPISSFQISPNPVSTRATLSFHSSIENEAMLWVTDASGKQVVNKLITLSKGDNNQELDVSQFGKGMYYLFLQTDQNIQYKKFVVVK